MIITDNLTSEQRRKCMANIRSKDTKPEKIVRKLLHSVGYRYRLHKKGLPGNPDIVFPCIKKVIFINGCFWHKHRCRRGKVKPKTNENYWDTKRNYNKIRDKKNIIDLRNMGWNVSVIWECWTKDMNKLKDKLFSVMATR